jgi:tetratricopeptide (TPR) repeat protein
MLAWDFIDRGDIAGAFDVLQAALRMAPNDPQTLVNLAGLLRLQGRLRDAVLRCDAAIAAAPGYADAWLERGYVLASGGSIAAAEECYRRVLEIEPDHAGAHAGLAAFAARHGDYEAGRGHAHKALLTDPQNAIATTALATIELETGHPGRARDLLEPRVAPLQDPSADRALMLNQLGDAWSRLKEPARAYDAYVRSKRDFASIHQSSFADRPSPIAFVDAITAGVASMDPAGWDGQLRRSFPNQAANHLFLLGYPRSGNTLCENILASVDGVVALEERPTLGAADLEFLASADGMARLSRLSEDEVGRYRQAYWDKVETAGVSVRGRCFVDMDPLKSLRLPAIARLFPGARVLITRRDPRDVVWSCFHTNFALSNAAMAFTTLESTARHYDAVMRLTEAALERLPLNAHLVRYDSLVGDFEATTRAMCAFAGLPWSADLIRFDRTAKSRGVSTASASQVRKPLYDGTRQWEPYAPFLAEVMPILAPWIERFGY